jgi:hypothetical protein
MPSAPRSALTRRLLDNTRHLDYAVAIAIGLAPAIYAKLIGVADDEQGFQGYWGQANYTTMIVFLPLALYFMRRGMNKIAPVLHPEPDKLPAIIGLVDPKGQAAAYKSLREAILSPKVIGAALLTDVFIHILDVTPLVKVYAMAASAGPSSYPGYPRPWRWPAGWRDWSMMFLLGGEMPSLAATLVLAFLAYFLQFCFVLIGVLFFYLTFRHNLFFLTTIFQRRWATIGQVRQSSIVINLDDPDKCFGFRAANEAFNVQVTYLAVCGMFMFASRLYHVPQVDLNQLSFSLMFPNAGQIFLGAGWLLALLVVSLPALVKLLPQIGSLLGPSLPNTSVATYLREFLPDDVCPVGEKPSVEEIDYLTSRFAENAFWPTGNNRAWFLFFGSFWIMLFLLFPLTNPLFLALSFVAALLLTALALGGLGLVLLGTDSRLVRVPPAPIPKPKSLTPAARPVEPLADLDIEIQPLGGTTYRITLKSSPFESNSVQHDSGKATLDPQALRAFRTGADYGKALGEAVFQDPVLAKAWHAADALAQSTGARLRVRLFMDEESVELHSIRWESLCFAGEPLFRGDDRWLSRYLSSAATPVPSKRRNDLKSLVVIASPTELADPDSQLGAVPVEAEKARAREFLSVFTGQDPGFLDSGGKPTLANIMARLKDDVDILYLVCHGSLTKGEPRLLLEKDSGAADFISGKDLVQGIKDLRCPPGLIVLASCQSASTGGTEDALAALGPRLAAAGVPAVVAMQGKIGQETVAHFMPALFGELKRNGRIDRAMAVARGDAALKKFPDWWMPVLFMRLRNGMLWDDEA